MCAWLWLIKFIAYYAFSLFWFIRFIILVNLNILVPYFSDSVSTSDSIGFDWSVLGAASTYILHCSSSIIKYQSYHMILWFSTDRKWLKTLWCACDRFSPLACLVGEKKPSVSRCLLPLTLVLELEYVCSPSLGLCSRLQLRLF